MNKEQQDKLVMFLITASQAMEVNANDAARQIREADLWISRAKVSLRALDAFRAQMLIVGQKFNGQQADLDDVARAMECPDFKQTIFADACDAADELACFGDIAERVRGFAAGFRGANIATPEGTDLEQALLALLEEPEIASEDEADRLAGQRDPR